MSSLVGMHRELAAIRCFGTDGESALIAAFKQVFTLSLNLVCFLHVRRNISAKMHELKIHEGAKKMILDNVFGKSTHRRARRCVE